MERFSHWSDISLFGIFNSNIYNMVRFKMTKSYCKCGKTMDEVEFTQFSSCIDCYMKHKKEDDEDES